MLVGVVDLEPTNISRSQAQSVGRWLLREDIALRADRFWFVGGTVRRHRTDVARRPDVAKPA